MIRVLPEALINQIAAGEVVERPASVVKELVENALDAGAEKIQVSVREGGTAYISVLDDGRGMDESDAVLAVQRHATSKIQSAKDLSAIQTLGFRGEALAAIASVSRFQLLTCAEESKGGLAIDLEGGKEVSQRHVGFPQGTRVTVEDLFFNTPARRKFLRKTQTEFQHLEEHLTQMALAHPEVHFRLTHNEKVVHDLPLAKTLVDRVYQLFGGDFSEGMVFVKGGEGVLEFEGMVSSPSASRASRRWQYLFVNGRVVKNPGMNHAIYQAYRTLLMKGRHPAYVLNLKLNPEEVDVNVHPAKTEVRLKSPQLLHTLLADKLHRALMDASRRRAFGLGGEATSPPPREKIALVAESPQLSMDSVDSPAFVSSRSDFPGGVGLAGGASEGSSETLEANPLNIGGFSFQPLSGKIQAQGEMTGSGEFTVVGQLHTTYLLVQRQGSLVLVDQHAAHERILFEAYRTAFYAGKIQTETFLVPLTLELTPQNALLLEQYLPQWEKMGFALEPFGKTTFLLREAPALLTGKDVEGLLLEALDDLALFGKSGRIEEVFNEIIERVACHSAIRAGMTLAFEEMDALMTQLEELDVNLYCPHGRPVWVEFSLRELEKRFKRIV